MLGSSPSMTIGGRGEGLLQQPQAPEARVAGAADDEVVVDGDAELLGGAAQFLGHGDVGGRGLGVAARMVVDEDEGGGAQLEGALHHLAGVDRGVVDGALLLHLVGDQAVALVEEQQAERLDLLSSEEHTSELKSLLRISYDVL